MVLIDLIVAWAGMRDYDEYVLHELSFGSFATAFSEPPSAISALSQSWQAYPAADEQCSHSPVTRQLSDKDLRDGLPPTLLRGSVVG
jgi:hypothetical protein